MVHIKKDFTLNVFVLTRFHCMTFPLQLFFQGKLKLSGNIMLSQKLQSLFEARSKLL